MSAASPASPDKPCLKGTLTVKVHRCYDLEKKRLLSAMDPYVRLDLGFEEHFKTKKHENGDRTPNFEQAFLFNLDGRQSDLHVKVYDSELLTDTYVGRADLALMSVLSTGGGEKAYPLVDPDNFRHSTGFVVLSISFSGTGGPSSAAEVAPIAGLFHFQHNSTGFLVHALPEKLELAAGGLNEQANAFEWQGPYIRYVPNSHYITGNGADGSIALKAGISEDAKWKWTGIGLQHERSGKLVHPKDDTLAPHTQLVLTSGSSAASGFSLVASKPAVYSMSTVSSPIASAPPATNPHASPSSSSAAATILPNVAALAIATPPHQEGHPGAYPSLAAAHVPKSGGWHCSHCTFENVASRNVCEMCSKSKSVAAAHPAWDLDIKATWPDTVNVTVHGHVLHKLGTIYRGTYNCDVCKLQGQGTVYHCEPCQWDCHPACAHQKQKH